MLVTTMLSTLVVLGFTGFFLIQMVSGGVVRAKRQAVINEANSAHAFMQQQLRGSDARNMAVGEALNRLAEQTSAQTTQYQMVIQSSTSTLVSGGLEASSVPAALAAKVHEVDGMYITPTSVHWADPAKESEPGFVIGASLITATNERVPVYYVFPMTAESQTLRLIQNAVIVSFTLLLGAMLVIVYAVTWQAVTPIRRASVTALRLASGQLDERMEERGTVEIQALASSMNQMAGELQTRIRQLESLSAVQRQFVSDVSHELRTPLTTIKMASDLLYASRHDIGAESRRTIELMWSEIERFDELLADLLEISRFDAGAAVLALDEHNFSQLVKEEIEAQRPLAERQGIELRLRVLSDDTRAELDDRRVRRILRNLLSNAIDHGQGKPVEVTVAADEDTVALTVRDHGIGFDCDQSAKVFDRFWRADPARTRVVGGTGLGLSIALEDAKLHRGWLSAWGRPGEGAQFRLTLPRTRNHNVLVSPLPVSPTFDEGSHE